MKITAKAIKELREISGAGILDVKKALDHANGDLEKAIEYLKKHGVAKAMKKTGRIAADGIAGVEFNNNKAVILELNCQTDFVALNKEFKTLFHTIINGLLSSADDQEEINLKIKGQSLDEVILDATARIGEKISYRRSEIIKKTPDQYFGIYVHPTNKIAAVVVIENGSELVAKNVSMHLAAMNPEFLRTSDIPATEMEQINLNVQKQMGETSNKPANIIMKIAEGLKRKQLAEIVLLEQEFVMDSKKTVGQYLRENNGKFIYAIRYEVGEGIKKVEEDFVGEVMKQMT